MDLEKPSLWLSDLGDQKARVPCPCFRLQRVTPAAQCLLLPLQQKQPQPSPERPLSSINIGSSLSRPLFSQGIDEPALLSLIL